MGKKQGKNDDELERQILKVYVANYRKVGPMKKYKRKVGMYEAVAYKINKKCNATTTGSGIQSTVERYRAVHRKAVVNNSKTGRAPVDVLHPDIFEHLCSVDDNIQPELIRSVEGVRYYKRK